MTTDELKTVEDYDRARQKAATKYAKQSKASLLAEIEKLNPEVRAQIDQNATEFRTAKQLATVLAGLVIVTPSNLLADPEEADTLLANKIHELLVELEQADSNGKKRIRKALRRLGYRLSEVKKEAT
jgi:hypothetical protein